MTKYTLLLGLALGLVSAIAFAGVDAAGHFSRAQVAWAEGDSDLALAEYQAVINLLGDDAASRHNRAIILLATARTVEALKEIERAVELSPDNGRYLVTLAVVMMGQAKPDFPAIGPHLQKAVDLISIQGDSLGLLQAYYNLGMLAQRRRSFPEARKWYKRALRIDPNDEATLTALESLEGKKE